MTDNFRTIIERAHREKWAIGEFNISSLESLQAIVDAAERLDSPAIIGTSMGTIRHLGFDYVRAITALARESASVPLFVHLDHGTREMAMRCIEAEWDSVMIDVSELPYAENVEITSEVAKLGHARGLLVEAQIGQTWDEEGEREVEQIDTEPADAAAFVRETGIDMLAVSIGNTPGSVTGEEAPIKIETLQKIVDLIDTPIVLHGATSIGDDTVREAIALGVAKVNIDTAIRRAITDTLASVFSAPEPPVDIRPAMARARQRAAEAVDEKIRLLGSAHRAAVAAAL